MKSPSWRPLAALITTALITTALLGSTVSPAAAAPEKIVLSKLSKGAAPATPYVVGQVLVDGEISVDLPKGVTRIVGKVRDGYLVQGYDYKRDKEVVVRVTPQGARKTLVRGGSLSDATLSDDGTSFVASKSSRSPRPTGSTVLRRYDAGTGDVTLKTQIDGYGRVLDYDGSVAIVGGSAPVGTQAWDVLGNKTVRVLEQAGYEADLATDRLATFTKDPYQGGCTAVSRLSNPSKVVWRSCAEAVEAWSPDGTRIATTHILADGIGPNRFTLRKISGRKLGVYDAPAYFGRIWFEDGTHVLADTFAKTKGAVVRCDTGGCERATAIKAHKTP